jgi:hypothetical protein
VSFIHRLPCFFTWSNSDGGRSWSERRSAGRALRLLQSVDEHVQAGGEPLVAVVDPDVFAEGDQGGEAVDG